MRLSNYFWAFIDRLIRSIKKHDQRPSPLKELKPWQI